MSTNDFVIVWDQTGLEYVGNITADEQHRIMAALSGQPAVSALPNIMHLRLRAQYNQQRHYEIYFLTAESSITEQDICDWFRTSPQQAADLVRERGQVFYSDRAQQRPVIV